MDQKSHQHHHKYRKHLKVQDLTNKLHKILEVHGKD